MFESIIHLIYTFPFFQLKTVSLYLSCVSLETVISTLPLPLPKLFSGGGDVSELMDRRECAILAVELVTKNLIFP